MTQSTEQRRSRTQETEEIQVGEEQVRAAKHAGSTAVEADVNDVSEVTQDTVDQMLKEIDALLGEVDEEQFVKSFIQRGGQ